MSLQALSQNLAYCSWFEGDRLQHGTFALSSLVADEVSPAAAALQEADAAIQHAKQMLDRVDLEVPLDDPDPNPPV